ncbi:hypothetical protein DFQ30_001691 [Apophysomyces sp. BC1015]|nr:hypothetical protein DFQ30_001691 [Apophysomyces sp. BC1015]
MIYPTIFECLTNFEDVIRANGQDINKVWHLYLPILLSGEQRSWYEANLKNHSSQPWSFAKKLLIEAYSINDAKYQVWLTSDLMSMKMKPGESVSTFTNRFEKLHCDSKTPDNIQMATVYLCALPERLAERVQTAQASLHVEQWSKVSQIAALARTLENGTSSQEVVAHTPTTVTRPSGGELNKSKKRRAEEKSCLLHGRGSHSSEECQAVQMVLQNAGTFASMHSPFKKTSKHLSSSHSPSSSQFSSSSVPTGQQPNTNSCCQCGKPYFHGHPCDRNKNGDKPTLTVHSANKLVHQ